jgi:hypothetical protein
MSKIVFHVEGSGTDSVIDPGQLKEQVGFGKEGNFSLCQEIIFLREFRYIPEVSGTCSTFNQVRRPFSSGAATKVIIEILEVKRMYVHADER